VFDPTVTVETQLGRGKRSPSSLGGGDIHYSTANGLRLPTDALEFGRGGADAGVAQLQSAFAAVLRSQDRSGGELQRGRG